MPLDVSALLRPREEALEAIKTDLKQAHSQTWESTGEFSQAKDNLHKDLSVEGQMLVKGTQTKQNQLAAEIYDDVSQWVLESELYSKRLADDFGTFLAAFQDKTRVVYKYGYQKYADRNDPKLNNTTKYTPITLESVFSEDGLAVITALMEESRRANAQEKYNNIRNAPLDTTDAIAVELRGEETKDIRDEYYLTHEELMEHQPRDRNQVIEDTIFEQIDGSLDPATIPALKAVGFEFSSEQAEKKAKIALQKDELLNAFKNAVTSEETPDFEAMPIPLAQEVNQLRDEISLASTHAERIFKVVSRNREDDYSYRIDGTQDSSVRSTIDEVKQLATEVISEENAERLYSLFAEEASKLTHEEFASVGEALNIEWHSFDPQEAAPRAEAA